MATLNLSQLRFLIELRDDPTKRVENLSAARMKILLELTQAKLVDYDNRAWITGRGIMFLTLVETELAANLKAASSFGTTEENKHG